MFLLFCLCVYSVLRVTCSCCFVCVCICDSFLCSISLVLPSDSLSCVLNSGATNVIVHRVLKTNTLRSH